MIQSGTDSPERRERKMDKFEFDVRSDKEFVKQMGALSQDGQCWITCVVFGHVYAKAVRWPSSIPYNAVGAAPRDFEGYWQNGVLHPFSQRLTLKYQNSCIGMA